MEAIGGLVPPEQSRDPLHNVPRKHSERVLKLIQAIPRDGGSRKDRAEELQLECHKRVQGFWDVYGRMAWNGPAPTITGGCTNPSKGRFIHPTANRAITLREAALLQTFPKSYRFPLEFGIETTALLIGNALPPEFVRRQARALARSVGL
jgi:DNA (cytosine-5)-methyltransferase 1